MAPIEISMDSFAAPLADYFFIAGIESSRIYSRNAPTTVHGTPSLVDTFGPNHNKQTNKDLPTSSLAPVASPVNGDGDVHINNAYRKSDGSSFKRQSIISNKSCSTVRPVDSADHHIAEQSFSDADFDQALRKFISNRDSFLEDIQFSSGQAAQADRHSPNVKPQRLSGHAQKREIGNAGSFRKRLSTMYHLSRQSSSVRKSSKRSSERMSGYASCIAIPQRLQPQKNTHPLKRTYEPSLLDAYPAQMLDQIDYQQSSFPEHVPMFVFPNDIHVIAADNKPKATWHGFVMTVADGSKLYGMCLVTWIPLRADAAEDLEYQCEQWRNEHMSDEERDMARDLGSRLAIEKAKLSQLLTTLPALAADSEERYMHEEEISKVEEKIALIADALRPVRHAAASKIEGLTDGETGFWIPRAFGVLGKDRGYSGFWKEWLRAVAVPMMGGAVLRVPPSSPRIGTWQPLERYVVNLCTEAPSPMTSITQVELSIRELRLYARKEATNEISGSRTTDFYALFRCLDIQTIVTLMEYVLMESRIAFLSSHTSMLALACAAVTQLLWPLKWAGSYIPVLPARLIQVLDAPCPYIIGIERRYEAIDFPKDDFVLVDLDKGTIEATAPHVPLPQQHANKLLSILQLAAPHHAKCGVPLGPPKYVIEAFPFDTFPSENRSLFEQDPPKCTLNRLATIDSALFGTTAIDDDNRRPPLFNAFLSQSRTKKVFGMKRSIPVPSTPRESIPPSPSESSLAGGFLGGLTPRLKRQDSGFALSSAFALSSSLREKRTGFRKGHEKRNSTATLMSMTGGKTFSAAERAPTQFGSLRRPSVPQTSHGPPASIYTIGGEASSTYAPSMYAHSVMAASTFMLNASTPSAEDTGNTAWAEGHCLEMQDNYEKASCSVCDEKGDDIMYKCKGCGMLSHAPCNERICLVCPASFHPDQIVAAFARCFVGLLYTYRKFVTPASIEEQKNGSVFRFNLDAFVGSVPHHHAEYLTALRDTQAFTCFVDTVKSAPPEANLDIQLFDELVAAKRNRSRAHGTSQFFSKPASFGFNSLNKKSTKSVKPTFLADSTDHLWRTAAVASPSNRSVSGGNHSRHSPVDVVEGDFGTSGAGFVGRVPSKLDSTLIGQPRIVHGAPRLELSMKRPRRKEVPRAGVLTVGNGNVFLNANAHGHETGLGLGLGSGIGLGLKLGTEGKRRSRDVFEILRGAENMGV